MDEKSSALVPEIQSSSVKLPETEGLESASSGSPLIQKAVPPPRTDTER